MDFITFASMAPAKSHNSLMGLGLFMHRPGANIRRRLRRRPTQDQFFAHLRMDPELVGGEDGGNHTVKLTFGRINCRRDFMAAVEQRERVLSPNRGSEVVQQQGGERGVPISGQNACRRRENSPQIRPSFAAEDLRRCCSEKPLCTR